MASDQTAAVREREAAAAAEILGIRTLDFWREPDGALRCTTALAGKLADVLRELRVFVALLQ